MWNIIKYNKHRSKFSFGIYLNKKQIKREIIFDSSCKYELPNNDWLDINKLFGIGYFIKHSTDSARFGWRYNPNENLIDIFAYCYVNKDRIKKYITSVPLNNKLTYIIDIVDNKYIFSVLRNGISINKVSVVFTHKKKLGYKLGLYFGGNNKSPKEMKIFIK